MRVGWKPDPAVAKLHKGHPDKRALNRRKPGLDLALARLLPGLTKPPATNGNESVQNLTAVWASVVMSQDRQEGELPMEGRNCWEVLKCGRQPDGASAGEVGECPAAAPNEYDGVNQGRHGGRFCWAVAGTLCNGAAKGTYSQKIVDCLRCEFLRQVETEEGKNFILTPQHAIFVREQEKGA